MYEFERREAAEPPRAKPFCTARPAHDASLDASMSAYLDQRGLSPGLAFNNGWYPSRMAGDALPRVVIPASSRQPGNHYWQARAMIETPQRFESPHGVARGDALVFVAPWQVRAGPVVIVEGPMDALAAAGEGFPALALLGATPPDEVIEYAAALLGGTLGILVLDADGRVARVAPRLSVCGVRIRLRLPYPYKDLAAAPFQERHRILIGDTP